MPEVIDCRVKTPSIQLLMVSPLFFMYSEDAEIDFSMKKILRAMVSVTSLPRAFLPGLVF